MNNLLTALGSIAAVLFVVLATWATANFSRWTGIQLSDQERQIIADAAAAIAGALKVMIAQGRLRPEDLASENLAVRSITHTHVTPDVALALQRRGQTVDDLTHAAVALVGHDHTLLVLAHGSVV